MKFVEPRPFSDPEVAARKLVKLSYAFEPVQDGRIKSCADAHPARSSTPNNPVSRHSSA
jgi:hypothetical protein